MTLRVVRWIQHGKLASLATVVALTSLLAVLFAVAHERASQDPGPVDGRRSGVSLLGPMPLVAGSGITCIPTSAHLSGAAGTNWRSDMEVHNPGSTQASYSIALLKHGEDNSAPTTQSFSLSPGQSVRYNDVVLERFAFNGKAALRVTATAGSIVVTSRTYNNQLTGTYGQFVPAFPDDQAITSEQEGRLIQLSHEPNAANGGFRTNLGVVNAGSGSISVTIDLYTSSGSYLGQVPLTLRAYEYQQIDKVFERVTGSAVTDGYTVVRTSTTGGRFFAYASVIDNRTGDPIFIPPTTTARGSAPPTPTPTATIPPGTVNLTPYTPQGWPNCVVCNYRQTDPPVSEALYANQTTYVYWAIANFGTSTFTGPLKFGVYFDGVRIFDLTWNNPNGLASNYYMPFLPTSMTVYASGTHTVEVRIDPDNAVSETNENDNSCAFSGTWGGAPLLRDGDGEVLPPPTVDAVEASPPTPIGSSAVPSDAVARTTASAFYIATSAHLAGAAGTNWRTDMEVHNPGSTQANYSIALLKHGEDNSSPAGQSFSLAPGRAVRYNDVISDLFAFNGKAALRVEPISGSIVVTSRTYNNQPSGTYGQFVPAIPDSQAITSEQEGRLIQLSHEPNTANGGFRTNLGAVNAGSSQIAVTIDLYAATGGYLGQVPLTLRAYEYQQIDKVFERVTGSAVSDGYAVVRTSTSGGRFFAYASVIDNRTGDPIFIPATATARGTTPPSGDVVTGPGGTTITLPSGGRTPNTPVTITTGNGADLPKSGETLVSTVIKVNVGGEGVSTGASGYLVKIPVTGTVSDPEKLVLKVQTSVGPVYPVAGIYDAGTKIFTAELMQLWDGWTMGVVTNPNLQVLNSVPGESPAVESLGWETPEDWRTCSWKIVNLAFSASTSYRTGITQALSTTCDHLRNARFRSPKLWIDGRYPPPRRIAWLVQGTGEHDPRTSFRSKKQEDEASFSMVGFNDEQMQSLGQLYFNWDEYQTDVAPNGWSYGHIVIHELFHAVQTGYDVRGRVWETTSYNGKEVQNDTRKWYKEGTSTLVAMTYQTNPNGLYGGEVTVRPDWEPGSLAVILESFVGDQTYARQDFFAYVAKRYNAGKLLDLRNLFQDLGDFTWNQFGKTDDEYRTLYRRAMDKHYTEAFGVTLPDLYTNFAVDRAYRHTEPALLRDVDRALPKGSLDRTIFRGLVVGAMQDLVTSWDPSRTPFVTELNSLYIGGLKPLQTWAIKVTVPPAAQTAGSLPITFALSGAPLGHQGVRIFVFRESNGVMVTGGETEVTDISQPVNVPVNSSIQTLTILVVNGSVEHTPAHVTLGQQSFTRISIQNTQAHTCNNPPACTQTCTTTGGSGFTPITSWNGNTFTLVIGGAWGRIEGQLASDGRSIVYFNHVTADQTVLVDWRNLPKIDARSTPDTWVFGVSGQAAQSHIVTWLICTGQGALDYTKPVVIEVTLAK